MLSSRPVALGLDAHVYPTKTPARSKGRVENSVPMTMHNVHKGKDIVMRTPYHGGTQQLHKASMTTQAQGKSIILATRPNARPLGDKTPFPNRARTERFNTPLQPLSKFPILSLHEPNSLPHATQTPDSALRPSSVRKQVRVPRSANKSFETPINNGNHWDVSDLDIEVSNVPVKEMLLEDDYDEAEHMPPNTLHLAYKPPFDFELPDYKEVGKTLFKLAHSFPYDDSIRPEYMLDAEEIGLPGWDLLPSTELESDDPFLHITGSAKPAPSIDSKSSLPLKPRANFPTKINRPFITKPVPSSQPTAALRPTPSFNKTASSRAGISPLIAPPTTTARSAVNAKSTTAKRPITSTTRVPPSNKGTTLPKTLITPATARPTAISKRVIPSRPATSTATRSCGASTTTPAERPATSATSYKPSAVRTLLRPTLGKVNPAVPKNKHREALSKDPIFLVNLDSNLDEDYRFEV